MDENEERILAGYWLQWQIAALRRLASGIDVSDELKTENEEKFLAGNLSVFKVSVFPLVKIVRIKLHQETI